MVTMVTMRTALRMPTENYIMLATLSQAIWSPKPGLARAAVPTALARRRLCADDTRECGRAVRVGFCVCGCVCVCKTGGGGGGGV